MYQIPIVGHTLVSPLQLPVHLKLKFSLPETGREGRFIFIREHLSRVKYIFSRENTPVEQPIPQIGN